MSITTALPESAQAAPSSAKSSSADSPIPPPTPVSPPPPMSLPASSAPLSSSPTSTSGAPGAGGPMKRKPSRRANTAERRATHNAVERQRRETLNGRFLDLAALLPNLSQIRRPSKSSIVNSSIAHLHAARRHRALAARELRLLKLESDALRRELNEWRDRSGLPRVEEPPRGDGFAVVMSGEVEVLVFAGQDEDGEDGGGYEGGFDDEGDDYPVGLLEDGDEEVMGMGMRNPMAQAAATSLLNKNANPFAHNLPPQQSPVNSNNGGFAQILPRLAPSSHGMQVQPMIANQSPATHFDNPAITSMYEPSPFPNTSQHSYAMNMNVNMNVNGQGDADKIAAWNAHIIQLANNPQMQQQQQQQQALFTPPSTRNGAGAPPNAFANPAFFANQQQQQQQQQMQRHQQQKQYAAMQQQQHVYGSPDADDASSVGSYHARERSSSGSPHDLSANTSLPGSFEMPGVLASSPLEYAPAHSLNHSHSHSMPRRSSVHMPGAVWDEREGAMKQVMNVNAPISVGGGGGGGGGGFGAMGMMMM